MTPVARPVSEVLKDILDNAQDIVRSEAKLVKAELYEEVGKSKRAAAWLAAAALAAIFAVGFLLVSAFLVLQTLTRGWIAAAIIAAACGLVCALCLTAKDLRAWAKQASK
jgi:uncharacterized membrane protein YhaH (DUF805 family)